MRSIQSRLGTGLAASLVAVFFLQWLVVSVALRQLSESGFTAHMEHDIDNLLAGVSFDAAGHLRLAPERIEKIYQKVFSGSYFRIASGDQVIRSRSLWDQDLASDEAPAGNGLTRYLPGPQSQPLIMRTRSFDWRGRRVVISVAGDLTPLENDMRGFRNRYALVSIVALALLLALQAFLVSKSLRPLRRARAELKQLERGETERLDESVPAELQPLVQELNHLLAVMKRRLTRSRLALGNLAHALKTPLTLLTHQVADENSREVPEQRREMQEQLQAMQHLVERELKHARRSGAVLPGQRFDFAAEIPPLIDTLKSLYRDRKLAIELRAPDAATFPADREDMLELLGNLLDNACKWSRGRVLIEIVTASGSVIIHVHDDGPGCPDQDLTDLIRRGARLDEAMPGHGLGLAIAFDTAKDYGGWMKFGRSEILGGFLASVRLASGRAGATDA